MPVSGSKALCLKAWPDRLESEDFDGDALLLLGDSGVTPLGDIASSKGLLLGDWTGLGDASGDL